MATVVLPDASAEAATATANRLQGRTTLRRHDALLVLAFGTACGVMQASDAVSAVAGAGSHEQGRAMLMYLPVNVIIYSVMAWVALLIERRRLAGWRYVVLVVPVALALSALLAFRDWIEPWQTEFLLEHGFAGSNLAIALQRFWYSVLYATLTFAYFARRRAQDDSAQRLATVQSDQRAAARRVAEAKLQSLTARVDPRLLFGLLDNVQRAYEVDPPRAERLLDELIVFLRAALSRLHRSVSTVQQECELVASYARLTTLAAAAEPACTSASALRVLETGAAAQARFPPGVLLPLVEDLLSGDDGTPIDISARIEGRRCGVTIASPRAPRDSALSRARDMLALHDAAGSIEVRPRGQRVVTTVEVVCDIADQPPHDERGATARAGAQAMSLADSAARTTTAAEH